MGTGRLDGSRFDLTVSLRHGFISHRADEWQASLARASELLLDATDGQHQFGTISVCPNSTGTSSADFFLVRGNGRSESTLGGLGTADAHATLCSDERFRPFVVLHEFGHHAYGLCDEYEGLHTAHAQCVGPAGAACIMEAGWEDGDRFGAAGDGGPLVVGRVSEFCVPADHDPDHDTYQDSVHHQSCWSTMVARFPRLTAPAGAPVGPAPGGAVAITWNVLLAVQRFALVLDRSADVAGPLLAELRIAADWWADAAVVGDQLGVVSFGDTPRTDISLTTITGDADRAAVRSVVADLQAGGARATGDGLREALGAVLAAGPRAANQVLVLVADGPTTAGPDPLALLPALLDNGVRIYTVAVGPLVDAALLDEIARTTGGAFFRVDPRLPDVDQVFRVRSTLQQISQRARDNAGFVAVRPGSAEPGTALERNVLIEQGSERATFAVTWQEPGPLTLTLLGPDGVTITDDAVPGGVRLITGRDPYVAFQVERPAAGAWLVTITAGSAPGPVPHLLLVTSENAGVTGFLDTVERRHRPGEAVLLHLQLYAEHPLVGLAVRGVAHLPDGTEIPLRFGDDGDPATGDGVPDDGLYTALLQQTGAPGVYTVEVEVESDGDAPRPAPSGEPPDPAETVTPDPVPAFRRRFETTFVITD